jgi:hypothetical protein
VKGEKESQKENDVSSAEKTLDSCRGRKMTAENTDIDTFMSAGDSAIRKIAAICKSQLHSQRT